MKQLFYILIVILLLSGCKTKERATERVTVTANAASETLATATTLAGQQSESTDVEQRHESSRSDSIVEKDYERIVTDSLGRVLLHERSHSRESYQGRGQKESSRHQRATDSSQSAMQHEAISTCDSTYEGGSQREVVCVKKRSWRWLWFVCLLTGLFATGFIISRVTRR